MSNCEFNSIEQFLKAVKSGEKKEANLQIYVDEETTLVTFYEMYEDERVKLLQCCAPDLLEYVFPKASIEWS